MSRTLPPPPTDSLGNPMPFTKATYAYPKSHSHRSPTSFMRKYFKDKTYSDQPQKLLHLLATRDKLALGNLATAGETKKTARDLGLKGYSSIKKSNLQEWHEKIVARARELYDSGYIFCGNPLYPDYQSYAVRLHPNGACCIKCRRQSGPHLETSHRFVPPLVQCIEIKDALKKENQVVRDEWTCPVSDCHERYQLPSYPPDHREKLPGDWYVGGDFQDYNRNKEFLLDVESFNYEAAIKRGTKNSMQLYRYLNERQAGTESQKDLCQAINNTKDKLVIAIAPQGSSYYPNPPPEHYENFFAYCHGDKVIIRILKSQKELEEEGEYQQQKKRIKHYYKKREENQNKQ